jgi:hypothetical protein
LTVIGRLLPLALARSTDRTLVRRYRVTARSPCYYHGMRGWVDPLLSIIAAIATALLLAPIARDDVGMPPGMVREDALIGASVMIAAVAGMSSRKRKQ